MHKLVFHLSVNEKKREIHRSPVNSTHKGQWCGALMYFLICVWINGWVNNREAGDLRRYRAHYDVTVMFSTLWHQTMPDTDWFIDCFIFYNTGFHLTDRHRYHRRFMGSWTKTHHYGKLCRAMRAPWVDRSLNNQIYCYPLFKKRRGPLLRSPRAWDPSVLYIMHADFFRLCRNCQV